MKAKIYALNKTAMQSGRGKTGQWVLEYDNPAERGPEALMGWTQVDNTLSQVRLEFKSCEDAVSYAVERGWEYHVATRQRRKIKPRNYSDNFVYRGEDNA